MQLFKNKSECCGCTACYNICPKHAIEMRTDKKGFKYPIINVNKCISCGLCEKVCAFKHFSPQTRKEKFEQEYYAARSKDKEVLKSSSSGGIFTVLSDYVLMQNGEVIGAAFDSLFVVRHIKANTFEQRDIMRGSKYVQSDLQDIFTYIKDKLKSSNIPIMFSGTPCQVDALRRFLEVSEINMEKLFLCDFICHGVSSPLIWKEYITYLETLSLAKVYKIKFRDKKFGWKNKQMSLSTSSGINDSLCNKKCSYLRLYSSLVANRESCFSCKYTTYHRTSDITLADFWNIDSISKKFNDNLGVSTVIVNTDKGKALFSLVNDKMIKEPVKKEGCWQPHLEYPGTQPKKFNQFWNDYFSTGSPYIFKKYGKGTLVNKAIQFLTPIIKKMGLYTVAGKMYNKVFGQKYHEN